MKAKTEVVDNQDGTYTVTYVPLTSGMYTLMLKYGGKSVPGFPANVMVDPAVDTSKVKVFGPGVEGQGVQLEPIRLGEKSLKFKCNDFKFPLQPFSEKPPRISQWTPDL